MHTFQCSGNYRLSKDQFRRDFIGNIHVHIQKIKYSPFSNFKIIKIQHHMLYVIQQSELPIHPKLFPLLVSSDCCIPCSPIRIVQRFSIHWNKASISRYSAFPVPSLDVLTYSIYKAFCNKTLRMELPKSDTNYRYKIIKIKITKRMVKIYRISK